MRSTSVVKKQESILRSVDLESHDKDVTLGPPILELNYCDCVHNAVLLSDIACLGLCTVFLVI